MRIQPIIGLCAVLVSGAVLNGCATLSEEQCAVGDWYGIGQSDGNSGYSHQRLEEHIEACQRHGVTPDHVQYEQGRRAGLRSYCTPERGFRAGRMGNSYGGVCPAELERDFLAGYSDGQIVYAAQGAYDAAQNDYNRHQQAARDLESRIRTEETAAQAPDLTDDQRRIIRDRIRSLRNDRDRALDQARDAEWRLREAERDVRDLRARFAAYYGSW